MVNTVFEIICSAIVILILIELAVLVAVSIHEVFRKKRNELREYYRKLNEKK